MSDEIKTTVGLQLHEEMIFRCDLGEMKVKDCYIDEKHKSEEEMWGPNPSRMLGMAVTGCLSASFTATAEVIIKRNAKGFWRIGKINVEITPKIDTPEMQKRADLCRKMFEDYCIVTQSVREGIDIDVNLNY